MASLAAQIIDQRVLGIAKQQADALVRELGLGTDEHCSLKRKVKSAKWLDSCSTAGSTVCSSCRRPSDEPT